MSGTVRTSGHTQNWRFTHTNSPSSDDSPEAVGSYRRQAPAPPSQRESQAPHQPGGLHPRESKHLSSAESYVQIGSPDAASSQRDGLPVEEESTLGATAPDSQRGRIRTSTNTSPPAVLLRAATPSPDTVPGRLGPKPGQQKGYTDSPAAVRYCDDSCSDDDDAAAEEGHDYEDGDYDEDELHEYGYDDSGAIGASTARALRRLPTLSIQQDLALPMAIASSDTPTGQPGGGRSPLSDVSNKSPSPSTGPKGFPSLSASGGQQDEESFEFPANSWDQNAPSRTARLQLAASSKHRAQGGSPATSPGQPAPNPLTPAGSTGSAPIPGPFQDSPTLPLGHNRQAQDEIPARTKAATSEAHADLGGRDVHQSPLPVSHVQVAVSVGNEACEAAGDCQQGLRKGRVLSQSLANSGYSNLKKLVLSAPIVVDTATATTPLPLPVSVESRINSLGAELPTPQKVLLWVGIFLDIASKISLVRELFRFAGDDLGWFFLFLLFLLVSSSCVTSYWLAHYTPATPELPETAHQGPRVYGYAKEDVRRLVRKTGAVFAFLQLGTVFAALRSLYGHEVKQRTTAMDLKGMRLVDGLFLTMSLSILQAYIGIKCSFEDVLCPGREGFDFFLGASIVCSLISGALGFLALDLDDIRMKKDDTHAREGACFFLFRLCELSCRSVLLALFAAVFGGFVFLAFLVHALLVIAIIWHGPPEVWKKVSTTARYDVRLWCGSNGKVTVTLPKPDDVKLLVACLAWPPSCFISDATDREGRFWWRGDLQVGRKCFWSLRPRHSIISFPVFQLLMAMEAAVMVGLTYAAAQPWTKMYLEVVVTLLALWCLFGMVWCSVVYGHQSEREAVPMHRVSSHPGLAATPKISPKPSKQASPHWHKGEPEAQAPSPLGGESMCPALELPAVNENDHQAEATRGHLTVPPGFAMTPEAVAAFNQFASESPAPASKRVSPMERIRRAAARRTSRGGEPSGGSTGTQERPSPAGRLGRSPLSAGSQASGRAGAQHSSKGGSAPEEGAAGLGGSPGLADTASSFSPRPARVKFVPASKTAKRLAGGR